MYLIVGLGNPEKQYEKTFHNMGFICAGDVAELLGAKFKKKECEASVAEAYVGGEKVIIARPLTYMNSSGRAVKQLMAKYKVPEEKLLVIYDDYRFAERKNPHPARAAVRGRITGCAVSSERRDSRISPVSGVGIRDEEVKIPIIDYVLSEVRKEDYELFAAACRKAGEAAAYFAKGNPIDRVMNEYN